MKFEPNIQKSSKNNKITQLVEKKNTIKHMPTQKERAETIKY
jgi:hypothetical protein